MSRLSKTNFCKNSKLNVWLNRDSVANNKLYANHLYVDFKISDDKYKKGC